MPGAGAGRRAEAFSAVGAPPAGAAPGELAPGGSSCGRGGGWRAAGWAASGRGAPRGAPSPLAEREAGSALLTASLEAELGPGPGQAGSQPSIPGGFLGSLRPPLLLHPVVTSHLGASRLGGRGRGAQGTSAGGVPGFPAALEEDALACPPLLRLPPPGDPGAGSAGSPAVQPSSPQRAAGSGLQHPSGRKAPSLPYRPGGRGSSGSGGRSLWCFMAGQLLSKSSVGWGRWGRGGGFPHGFWEEAEQRGPRPGGAPSLQPEPRAALAAGVSPRPQVSSRTRGEGSLKGPPTAARAAPQVLVTKGSTWLPVICWGLSFFFFFFRHRLFSFFAFDIHVWFVNAKTRIPAFSQ